MLLVQNSLMGTNTKYIKIILVIGCMALMVSSATCPTGVNIIPNCISCVVNSGNSIVCSACLNGFYLASANVCRRCQLELANCAFCVINGLNPTCSICNNNYGILNNACKSCEDILGCETCQIFNNNIKCNSCKAGLVLYQAQTTCVVCQIANCQRCSISNTEVFTCQACLASYYLINNRCTLCGNAIQYCSRCQNDQNNRLICTSCVALGFSLSNNTCVVNCTFGGLTFCTNCEIVNLNTNLMRCLSCLANYYLDPSTRICRNCSEVLIGCVSCNGAIMNVTTNATNTTNASSSMSTVVSCDSCREGYYLFGVPAKCILCSDVVQNCSKCLFSTSVGKALCTECSSGYILNITTSLCSPCSTLLTNFVLNSCSRCALNATGGGATCLNCTNSYIFSNGTCIACNAFLGNCLSCSTTSVCLSCLNGYLLNSVGQCQLCSNTIPNCFSCIGLQCTDCLPSFYTIDNKNCIVNCIVQNCMQCVQKNNKKCSKCLGGYTLNNNFQCQANRCQLPTIFNGVECACPFSTYIQASLCLACSDTNCLICPADSCKQCKLQYFLANATSNCVKCMNNCLFCQAIDFCNLCLEGYSFLNGQCTANFNGITEQIGIMATNNIFQLCVIGCRLCSSIVTCQACNIGFYMNNSLCYSCPTNCRTCIFLNRIVNATIVNSTVTCVLCYQGIALINTTCLACTDVNCIDCKFNVFFCLLCSVTYAPDSLGNCKSCADNCDYCDVSGPSKCDVQNCSLGFSRLSSGLCLKCLIGCASCEPTYPFTCLGCLEGSYLLNSSNLSCANCPEECNTCSNSSFCISCRYLYSLQSGKCSYNCQLPCLKCTFDMVKTQNCSLCLQGYIIQNGICKPNFSCLAQNTCQFCSLGMFLYKGSCFSCMQSCRKCQFKNSDPTFVIANNNQLPFLTCSVCAKSSYLSNLTCQICRQQCLSCLSLNECYQCKTGYFLQYKSLNWQTAVNYSIGICMSCLKPCLSCINYPNRCTSCPSGFKLTNFICVAINSISFNIVLSSGANHTTTFYNIVNQMNDIFLSICDLLGSTFRSNNYLVVIRSITNGSVIIAGNAGIDNSTSDPSIVYNDASSNLQNAKLLSSFPITSSSLNAENFIPSAPQDTPTTTPSLLLYFIIGGAILLAVLLAVTIICCYRYRKRKLQQENCTQKRSSEVQNQPATSKNMLKNQRLQSQQKKSNMNSREKSNSKKVVKEISHISETLSHEDQDNKRSSRPKLSVEKQRQRSRRQIESNEQKSGMIPKRSNYIKQKGSWNEPQYKENSKSKSKSKDKYEQNSKTLKKNKKDQNDQSELKYRKKKGQGKISAVEQNDRQNKSKEDPISRRYMPNSNTQYI